MKQSIFTFGLDHTKPANNQSYIQSDNLFRSKWVCTVKRKKRKKKLRVLIPQSKIVEK